MKNFSEWTVKTDILKEEEMIKVEAKGEKREGSLPMLYIPGWGETSRSTQPLLEVLAQDNDVISFDQPREMRVDKNIAKEKFKGTFSALQLQKALAAIDTIEQAGYTQVDAIGSSEGGMILTIAAYLAPEKFRNITLVSPAGMIGKDSFWKLIKRFVKDNGSQNKNRPLEQQEQFAISTKDFVKFVKENLTQSLREIKEMSKADIVGMLASLHKIGINIVIVSHVDDKVFNSDLVQREISKGLVERNDKGKNNLLFDGLYTVMSKEKGENGKMQRYEGGHSDIKYDKNFQKQLLGIVRTLSDKSIKKKTTKGK